MSGARGGPVRRVGGWCGTPCPSFVLVRAAPFSPRSASAVPSGTVRNAVLRRPSQAIALVVGTRPEIIKLSVLSGLLGERGYLVHTGQHFDDNLSDAFVRELGLARPSVRLRGVGGAPREAQFSRVIDGLGGHFAEYRPAAVVVQGDTNTAAAAALAAHFTGVPVVHVEAGLRSRDRAMPEEINRMLVGVVADVHCAPTRQAADNLLLTGVDPNAVHVTGNTVIEATRAFVPSPHDAAALLDSYGLEPDGYILATVHRAENTDDGERLAAVLTELATLPLPVVFPAHPRTRAAAERHGLLAELDRLHPIAPLGYRAFLGLAAHARLLVSDSGGLQEECTVLKKPLIVVRNSTERPEAFETGFAYLAQPGPAIGRVAEVLLGDRELAGRLAGTPSPFGDGRASERIAGLLAELELEQAAAGLAGVAA